MVVVCSFLKQKEGETNSEGRAYVSSDQVSYIFVVYPKKCLWKCLKQYVTQPLLENMNPLQWVLFSVHEDQGKQTAFQCSVSASSGLSLHPRAVVDSDDILSFLTVHTPC